MGFTETPHCTLLCSRYQSEIRRLKISSPVRVCQNCYYNLQHERSVDDGARN
ncbi:WD repeat and FYVE domain-containing protein 3 [Oryzias melastigma]|uniref:WD repeat and FYVE domain-containing protein 3 n=1 Tax=Oryzias melastigma TaxID=30732 RepID=A0A834C135_ORYME|nr:WD repeat and FYVE domain-containing protein 3 [Oryzias melastigma]